MWVVVLLVITALAVVVINGQVLQLEARRQSRSFKYVLLKNLRAYLIAATFSLAFFGVLATWLGSIEVSSYSRRTLVSLLNG